MIDYVCGLGHIGQGVHDHKHALEDALEKLNELLKRSEINEDQLISIETKVDDKCVLAYAYYWKRQQV